MSKIKRIYVAATSQHVGKTTSTLGLVANLSDMGINVGYCKPVGQQYIDVGPSRADKDALLFSTVMDFDLVPELHSPVILGDGATTSYLDNPQQYNFNTRILKASKILDSKHDVVVYEGTGHPGVGSVVGLSNAKVAHMLHAGLIMIVEAGIGKTIDALDLNLSVFEQKKIPILGVILNKALPSKIEKVRHYVGKVLKQRNIDLLGILPYEEELGLPIMQTIAVAIKANITQNEEQLDNRVKGIIAGSLIDLKKLNNFNNQLLVVSVNRLDDALKKLAQVSRLLEIEETPLSGIIITGDGEIQEEHVGYFNEFKIPVLRSLMDTYEVVKKISQIEVKINTRTPWKVKKAIELFKEHVNLESLLERID
ncbi:MAG: AAA family ATPase [Bacteroidetes bacterium]|nr:AAA family ATPase [Bacteroidota bacterium]